MAKDPKDTLQAVISSLTETSRHLAQAASTLADGAVPTLRGQGAAPPAALPMAELIGAGADPIARSAPDVANSVPLLAPMLDRL